MTYEQFLAAREDAQRELACILPKEREALVLMFKGLTIDEIAGHLGNHRNTIENRLKSARDKLRMTSIEAAVLATRAGWV